MHLLFVNLPVEDVQRSKRFFSELGFEINEEFSDDKAACVVFSEAGYAMLLDRRFFRRFIDDEVATPSEGTQVVTALSVASKEEVDQIHERALAAGGSDHVAREPMAMEQMHLRSFKDPDGHVWEVLHMDMG